MAKFGPGTTTKLKLSRAKEFKATGNAIENKNRPEAVYIELSSWVKPKMSLVKARVNSTYDPESLAVEIAKQFDKELGTLKRKIANFFDPNYFNTSSIIFTYDFAASMAKIEKRQFVEIVVHIETVNDIDVNDEPTIYAGTGKMHHIPFKDFIKPMEDATNKILGMDVFNKVKSSMDFSVTKGK